MDRVIDRYDDLPTDLSCELLRRQYLTGRTLRPKGEKPRGRRSPVNYRTGVATEIGDIEEHVWADAVRAVVIRNGEQDILRRLEALVNQACPWVRGKKEIDREALTWYANRIWEDPKWVLYDRFNGGVTDG